MLTTAALAAFAVGATAPAAANQLETAYRLALANDPILSAAAAQRDTALQARPLARSTLLPQISVQANLTESEFDQTSRSTSTFGGQTLLSDTTREGGSTNTGVTLTVSQTVFDWSAFKQLKRSDKELALAQADYLVEEQRSIVRVANAYFDAVAATDQVQFSAADKRAIERQLEQAQKRYEVGLSALTDVQEAQARYDLTVADEIEAKRQLRTTREALREITGQYLSDPQNLAGPLELEPPVPADPDQWVARALQSNFALEAERLRSEIAQDSIAVQHGARYPTVALIGSASIQDQSGDTQTTNNENGVTDPEFPFETESENYSIGLQLNWNAFTGLRTSAQIRQAESQYAQQAALTEQQARAVERQIRDAYDAVLAGISRVKALRQAVKSNQTALDASEAGFRVGNRTSVDVLDAQRELSRARTDYARARYDYIIARLNLKLAAGQLTIDDLIAVDRLLANETPSS